MSITGSMGSPGGKAPQRAGNIYDPATGVVALRVAFGGWKSSLFGDSHVHGREGDHFYSAARS
jgi:acyl-CoA reductase-like NAD-dependent aldehyde dehydrogenase